MAHTCHATDCSVGVPASMWGCKKHWFMVPKLLRNEVWATYRTGQEITKDPSEEYLDAMLAAVDAVDAKESAP